MSPLIPANWKRLGLGIYHDPVEESLNMVVEEMLDHFGWPHTPEYETVAIAAFEKAVLKRWPHMDVRQPRR